MTGAILNTLIGMGVGLFKSWMSATAEAKNRQHEMYMEKQGVIFRDRERAGALKNVSFTRRSIALSFTFALVIAPVWYAFAHPYATITIPNMTHQYGLLGMLLPWSESVEKVEYIQVPAMAMVWSLYEMYALIVGFYFGSGGSRGR